jgi:hypothetical protein
VGAKFIPMSAIAQAWTGPFLIVALRVGAMLVMMALLWALVSGPGAGRARPMLTQGRATLVVYWVHVELAYGNVSYPLHKGLPLLWALAGFGLVTFAMYGLALWWNERPRGTPLVPPHMLAPVRFWPSHSR